MTLKPSLETCNRGDTRGEREREQMRREGGNSEEEEWKPETSGGMRRDGGRVQRRNGEVG